MNSDNASALEIGESIISSNTYESTSHPPRSVKSFSNFGDSACGEPLLAQHVIVDFTPKEDIDTDFLQRKVCSFWEFVSVRPELRDILVLPEPNMFKRTTSSDVTSKDTKYESRHSSGSKELTKDRTAVSMLEFVEERGLIDRTFESKLPQSLCSLGSREYHETEIPVDIDKVVIHKKEKCGNSYQNIIKYSKRTQTTNFSMDRTRDGVRNLCKNMKQWDVLHPKCMKSPRHPYSSYRDLRRKSPS